jgi:hypothetical protein
MDFSKLSKNIEIWDSGISYTNVKISQLEKLINNGSKIKPEKKKLSVRNPFRRDDDLIRYDQDSEEELADLQGEKLSEGAMEEDDES